MLSNATCVSLHHVNANPGAVCLSNLEVPFDFPRTVVVTPPSGAVGVTGEPAPAQVAAPEDFVVQCYYVGVRSREASAAPGTAAASASAFAPAVGGLMFTLFIPCA